MNYPRKPPTNEVIACECGAQVMLRGLTIPPHAHQRRGGAQCDLSGCIIVGASSDLRC